MGVISKPSGEVSQMKNEPATTFFHGNFNNNELPRLEWCRDEPLGML
jgi:hypothetical protein